MFISGQSSIFHPCKRQENTMGTRENRIGTVVAKSATEPKHNVSVERKHFNENNIVIALAGLGVHVHSGHPRLRRRSSTLRDSRQLHRCPEARTSASRSDGQTQSQGSPRFRSCAAWICRRNFRRPTGSAPPGSARRRSEERRVGKECR